MSRLTRRTAVLLALALPGGSPLQIGPVRPTFTSSTASNAVARRQFVRKLGLAASSALVVGSPPATAAHKAIRSPGRASDRTAEISTLSLASFSLGLWWQLSERAMSQQHVRSWAATPARLAADAGADAVHRVRRRFIVEEWWEPRFHGVFERSPALIPWRRKAHGGKGLDHAPLDGVYRGSYSEEGSIGFTTYQLSFMPEARTAVEEVESDHETNGADESTRHCGTFYGTGTDVGSRFIVESGVYCLETGVFAWTERSVRKGRESMSCDCFGRVVPGGARSSCAPPPAARTPLP